MIKHLRFLASLLLLAVASVAWGEEFTYDFSTGGTFNSGDKPTCTWVTDYFTILQEQNTSTSKVANYTTAPRWYQNHHVTFTPADDITITSIVINCSTTNNGQAITASTGSVSASGNNSTWTGTITASSPLVLTMGKQCRPTSLVVTYTSGGSTTETVATPTFSPAAGTYVGTQSVTISTTTAGATVYYTTDGTEPTASSSVYSSAISVSANTTIKAIAVKEGLDNSAIATATYTILQAVSGYNVDFESELASYVDWTFTNAEKSTGAITAHGGTYYATTGGKTTAVFQTKEKVAYPNVFTCYVSKTSTNATASTWEIQVSSDGSSWTTVAEKSATNMDKGEWSEFTADIKAAGYTDVYVRLFYSGSTAVRTVDDISLTTYTPAAVEEPIITVAEEFTFSTTATITCVTEGATIYYSFDNENWTEYTDALTLTATTTIYAKAVKGEDESSVAQATATKVLVTPEVAISATNLNVGETATVTTDGPVVTLSTSDPAVASVDGTTVTAVALGTATITASWEANGDYAAGSKVFEITVTDPNAPGQQNNPYTVAQARAAIDAGTGVTGVYATGTVSEIVTPYNSQYGNISYNISTDGLTTSDQLQAYRGKSYNGDNFTSEDDIHVGDVVVIYGNLTKYENSNNGAIIYEFEADNQLISLTRPEKPKHQVSFYVNGEVSSTREVSEEEAITFPENPADIEGKTFVGWTANEIEGTQDEAPEMVTTATMGTADVAFYAVFATATEGGIVENEDVLNRATTGVTGTSYTAWSGKTVNSSAVYAGQSAGGNDCIQLRSDNSNSGVITTKSGGKLKSMFVTWGSTTNNARVLSIYGSNTAYSAATDLYDSDTQGTLIGEIKCEDKGTDLNSAVLTITDDYAYIGIRSKSGALYLSSVSITWEGEGAASYSGYCTTIPTPEIITVTIKDAGYATFANEKAVDFSAQAGLTVMTAQYDADNDKIVYNEVTSKKVPAGVAVVLKGTADDYEGKVIASADALENNGLKVNLTENVDATGKEYCLAKLNGVVGFYKVATTTYVKAGKAYLEIERPDATSNAKDFYAIEDDTDGIGQIENGELTIENSVVYDLSGRKVGEVSGRLPKGIYIVNGKKVVVK